MAQIFVEGSVPGAAIAPLGYVGQSWCPGGQSGARRDTNDSACKTHRECQPRWEKAGYFSMLRLLVEVSAQFCG